MIKKSLAVKENVWKLCEKERERASLDLYESESLNNNFPAVEAHDVMGKLYKNVGEELTMYNTYILYIYLCCPQGTKLLLLSPS